MSVDTCGCWVCVVGGVVTVEPVLTSLSPLSVCPFYWVILIVMVPGCPSRLVVGLTLSTGCRLGFVVVIVPVLMMVLMVSPVSTSVKVHTCSGCPGSLAVGLIHPTRVSFGPRGRSGVVDCVMVLLMSDSGCPCCHCSGDMIELGRPPGEWVGLMTDDRLSMSPWSPS